MIDPHRDDAMSNRAVLNRRIEKLQAHILELADSEEKAWQTVAKLRVELETTDRLRLKVAEMIAERDYAMEDLHRLTDAFECSEHPDALHMVRCTACGKERHVPA